MLAVPDVRNPAWALGMLVRIDDSAIGQVTQYAYDFAGNRLRELTTQNGTLVQNNHTSYDALGRIVRVADGRYDVRTEYDEPSWV